MTRFFIRIFHGLQQHRTLMWILLLLTSALFLTFSLRLHFEEDISKLLPKTERSEACSLAFNQLAIKDKLFIQLSFTDGHADAEQLALLSDEFAEALLAKDSSSQLIAYLFYRLEDEWMLNGMDYALGQFPCLIDTCVYRSFDSLLQPSVLEQRMALNAEVFDNDMDGTASDLLCYDPAGLRFALLQPLKGLDRKAAGFSLLKGHLMTPDSTDALLFLTPTQSSSNSKACGDLVKMVRRTGKEFSESHPGTEILYHGAIAASAGNAGRIKKDLLVTMSLSLLLIFVILRLFMGHRSTLPLLLFPVLYGTLFSMAGIYWIKGSMSLMALGLGALVLGIALSYTLHVLMHHKYLDNPEQVVREQAVPLCLSCLTTIGALLSLMFTRSELLSDFGLFAALALFGTTLCSLIFLPQFLNGKNSRRNDRAIALLDRINSFPLDRKPVLLVVLGLLCIGCFITSNWVKFDNDLGNISYQPEEVARSQKMYNEKVNRGYSSVFYASTDTSLEEAMRINRRLSRTLDSLQRSGLVKQYSDISLLCLSREEQQQRIDAWKAYWTPQRIQDTRHKVNEAARRHGLEAEIFDPFFLLAEADYEPDLLLESEALPYELSSNFMEKVNDDYLIFTSALVKEEESDSLSDILSVLPGVIVANPYYYTDDMVKVVHESFNTIMLFSSLFVLLVLLLSFRSLVNALIAFLPMFLSWYVVQGLMAVFGIEFNLINIILSSFIFGVGVDYSIFTMKGLIASARSKDTSLLSHHRAAIVLSAFMLIVVAASLLVAVHPSVHSVGICTLIGMSTAILFSYSIQPFIFRQLAKIGFFSKRMIK